MLVLAADHGFERGARAVRALASTGVTPWRSVISGLQVALGRKSKLSSFDSISRLVTEITSSTDPRAVIVQRMRVGDSIPGFETTIYHPKGDPRAQALLGFCIETFPTDTTFRRLSAALETVKEISGQEPNFALACIFVAMKLGFGQRESLFHLGRTAGWVAHAIEQYQHGEMQREKGLYKGPLP
jgi:citrate synthase